MNDYSNFHNIDISNKIIDDGKSILEQALQGFESYEITVDGVTKRAVISSRYGNDNELKTVTTIGDMTYGALVVHDNKNWLVTELPKNNKIEEWSVLTLCNNVLTLIDETEGSQIGTDPLGRPIYSESTSTTHEFPCIVKSVRELIDGDQEQINLVESKIALQIKNQTNPVLTVGQEFSMFENKYRIYGFDRSKTFNNNGLLTVLAEKI